MKRSLLVTIAVIIFSLLLVTGAFATVRCVNLTGTAGCYPSIQVAVNASSAGDTVAINPGVYYQGTTEVGSVSPQIGLTLVGAKTTMSGSSIVIMSLALPGQVVLDIIGNTFLGAPGSTGDGIDIDSNSPLVTVKNLTVRNVDQVGIYTEADFTTITNVQIFNTYDDGDESAIYIDGNNAKITNCLISGIYGYPIYVDGYNNTLVQNNTIKNVYYEIYLGGNNNSLIGNTLNGVYDDDCLEMDGDNGVIKNNTFSNCYGDGIYVVDTSNGYTITGNKVISLENDCMELYVTNSLISANTLTGCNGYGIYNDPTAAPYGYNIYTNNVISFTANSGMYIDDDKPTVKFNSVLNVMGTSTEGSCYELSYNTTCVNGAVISNNTCVNPNYYGFETYFNGATISNNTADSTTEDGFYISYCNSAGTNTITGNKASNTGYDTYGGDRGGFYIEGYNNTITSNQAINNPGWGFEIDNYGGTTNVTNNTSTNNGATGLSIESVVGTVNVVSNTIKNNQGEGLVSESTAVLPDVLNANTNTVTGNRVDVCITAGASFNGTFTSNIFSTGGVFTPCDLD